MERDSLSYLEALPKTQILETIPTGLFLVDKNRHIVYWNPEAERITGFSQGEMVGQHCSVLKGIECGIGCGLYGANAPEKPLVGTICHLRAKSGEELIITKNIDFLRLNGEIIGGIETFIDSTQQKKLENRLRSKTEDLEEIVEARTTALQAERKKLRRILNSMTDMAYIVTSDFRIDFFNQAMEDVFGPRQDAFCFQIIYDRQEPCKDCPWVDIQSGQTIVKETSFSKAEGRFYEVSHTPVLGVRGQIQKLAVCRDITQRKEKEEKLLENNRYLDWFVGAVSHNLRSPLTPLVGYSEFLLVNYKDSLDARGISLLREINEQAFRLSNLIEDLLELSYVHALPLPDEPININQITEQILKENSGEIRSKNLNVEIETLPRIQIQESLLYQVMSNLIMNAVLYGSNPGDTIEVCGSSNEMTQTLIVRDHGPGIPLEERSKVFDMFYRGSTSQKSPGTGIGLATVKKIIDLCNGTIKIHETEGGGCTIEVVFPSKKKII